VSGKYDPVLEDIIAEALFEHYGHFHEDLPRKIAVKAHTFYSENELSVEVNDA